MVKRITSNDEILSSILSEGKETYCYFGIFDDQMSGMKCHSEFQDSFIPTASNDAANSARRRFEGTESRVFRF